MTLNIDPSINTELFNPLTPPTLLGSPLFKERIIPIQEQEIIQEPLIKKKGTKFFKLMKNLDDLEKRTELLKDKKLKKNETVSQEIQTVPELPNNSKELDFFKLMKSRETLTGAIKIKRAKQTLKKYKENPPEKIPKKKTITEAQLIEKLKEFKQPEQVDIKELIPKLVPFLPSTASQQEPVDLQDLIQKLTPELIPRIIPLLPKTGIPPPPLPPNGLPPPPPPPPKGLLPPPPIKKIETPQELEERLYKEDIKAGYSMEIVEKRKKDREKKRIETEKKEAEKKLKGNMMAELKQSQIKRKITALKKESEAEMNKDASFYQALIRRYLAKQKK